MRKDIRWDLFHGLMPATIIVGAILYAGVMYGLQHTSEQRPDYQLQKELKSADESQKTH